MLDLFAKQWEPQGLGFKSSVFRQFRGDMLQQIMTYASMIAMAFAVLLWIQSNFVDAGDFQEYQYEQTEAEVNYLKDKEQRLEDDFSELEYEDKRQLQRQELKLQKLRQELGK